MLQETINRIHRMECCFDALREAPSAIRESAALREQLRLLTAYYEGGQWLQDYTLDEQGLLPRDLKRGVLAQDALYDFLAQIKANEILG